MGRPFIEYYDGRCYCCKVCRHHLAKHDELVSTQFHSKNGQAYLFNHAINIRPGPKEERMMTTGLHLVVDIFCAGCQSDIGWKYEEAYEQSQKYKEGKYILEKCKIVEEVDTDASSASQYSNSDSDDV